MKKNIKKKYNVPVVATDVVIFTIKEEKLHVLLIKMKKAPYEKCWALPGGLVQPEESIDAAALRHLSTKTNVKDIYLEQLYTFGEIDRDPFGRVVSVAYMALLPTDQYNLLTTEDYGGVKWQNIQSLPALAYDHKEIIHYALQRIQSKLKYSNVAYSLLPNEFTLTELQKVYEIILRKKFDKRNFRKKILSVGLLKKTNKKRVGERSRPALLYTFSKSQPELVEIF